MNIDTFSHSLGLLEGWCMGKDAPQEIKQALRDINRKPVGTSTDKPPLSALDINEDGFLGKKSPADKLIDREATRVEKARAEEASQDTAPKEKKPRKPFSPAELERRRKQLADARSRRKPKEKSTPRDPLTKDMFPEKN